jgi:hypothetical protein
MKHLILLILIISGYQSLAQKTNAELEREISTLKSNQEIRAYWTKLHQDDQSVRGKVTEEQRETDRENIKKMLLLFKYHGYPLAFSYGNKSSSSDQNNFTPNIILTHNKVLTINEFIFPILKQAYVEGKANEFWYIHNLRGMTRARYGRDFHAKTKENIPLFYEKLSPFVEDSISYDIEKIDSLFRDYDLELSKIVGSKLIFSKKTKRIRHNIYKTKTGKIYWQKVYPDGSFNFPQEIYLDQENNCLRYTLLDEVIKNEVVVKSIELIQIENKTVVNKN